MKHRECSGGCVYAGRARWAAALLALAWPCLAGAQQLPEGRLMRFPDIYKDKVAFSYGGDLWLVSSAGGIARRITTNPGLELFPKFSPDGKWIAFTGQYDGNFNVYIMPSEGGQPRQLTFLPDIGDIPERMGPNNEAIAWTPDSKRIVFLSRRNTYNEWFGRLFTVSVEGGLPEQLPVPKGGLLSFSADGTKMAYNRIFRNFRARKRYKGGMAQDIWIYDFKADTIKRITHYPGTDTFPMWTGGDMLYWVSDRGPEQRENLYSRNLATGQTRQLTHFKEFDVNWPGMGTGSIIFENGGWLYIYDVNTGQMRKLTVYLPGDLDAVRRRWRPVENLITDFGLAPNGNEAVFTARGDVYTVPAAAGGTTRDLTRTPGIREMYSIWSPDGKWIAYMSDRTGEYELYITPADGSGPETRITFDGRVFRRPPVWAPDSQKLLFADKDVRLWYVDIRTKKPVLIDQGHYNDFQGYNWSPDSKWAAYGKTGENQNAVICVYSLADGKITPVTSGFYNSVTPEFDPAGRYLYFLSQRSYNETTGVYDFGFSNPMATRVYAVTLKANLQSPFFVPANGETKEQANPPQTAFGIDLAGIEDRVAGLPKPPGNLIMLKASKDAIFYSVEPAQGLAGPLPGETPEIHGYDLKTRKDAVLVTGSSHFALSFDGKKLLYEARKKSVEGESFEQFGAVPRTFGIVDTTLPPKEPHKVGDGALSLSNMQADLDPRAEWRQMFNETWRQERDFFFERDMNGVDWNAQREKYGPLVDHAGSRYDLTYIISEMIGELANSHTYVGGGDYPDLHPVNVGLLGVDFAPDPAHGLYRIARIYPGQNWHTSLRSPLTEPGVDVKAGDYLLAVNGRPLRMPQNPYELFVNDANKDLTLTVNSQPGPEGAREVTVKPIGSEFTLRELEHIASNRRKVDAMSGGRVAYVYMRDMGSAGLNQFVEQFFPQIRKEGLVLDIRYNGGGFVDEMIFERLRRILVGMQSARNWKSATIPEAVFNGYMACIANAYTASDGDFFAHFFKVYKLGPLVGERTWGGVRGITGYFPLMDGGYITRPEFSLYGLDSKWQVENVGVWPDVPVDNLPNLVMKGEDPQLAKAVDLVMTQIREHPKQLPPRPPQLPPYPPLPGTPTVPAGPSGQARR